MFVYTPGQGDLVTSLGTCGSSKSDLCEITPDVHDSTTDLRSADVDE